MIEPWEIARLAERAEAAAELPIAAILYDLAALVEEARAGDASARAELIDRGLAVPADRFARGRRLGPPPRIALAE